jgi:hypothetical protein
VEWRVLIEERSAALRAGIGKPFLDGANDLDYVFPDELHHIRCHPRFAMVDDSPECALPDATVVMTRVDAPQDQRLLYRQSFGIADLVGEIDARRDAQSLARENDCSNIV